MEAGNLDAVAGDVDGFKKAMEGSEDLTQVLTSPSYSAANRVDVLRALLSDKVQPLTLKFLLLLAERDRLRYFEAVHREFQILRDSQAGIVRVHISSATAMDEAVEKDLAAALQKRVGGTIEVTREVDPELLGGVVTQVGNLVFDGSLKTQVMRMKRHLGQA